MHFLQQQLQWNRKQIYLFRKLHLYSLNRFSKTKKKEGKKSSIFPSFNYCNAKNHLLRLVFTSDGVGVGVVIRSVKRYDLVKIKQRSRKQSFLLRLRFRRLRSSENQFVGVVSRSGRTKPIIKRGNEHRDWFILPLPLPTPTIWFSLDRKRRNHKRSRKKMETF